MLKLTPFRSRKRGFSDLLPYAALLAPDVALCKDGTFLASFSSFGPDTASATDTELAGVSKRFNNAVVRVLCQEPGWMLHVDASRINYLVYPDEEDGYFPDPVTRLIDDERREFFSRDDCFRTECVITFCYKPDLNAEKMVSLTRSGVTESSAFQRSLEYFHKTMQEMEDALISILRLRRLGEYISDNGVRCSELLAFLDWCASGARHPVRVPDAPMYLDALLGCEDLVTGLTPKLGERCILSISLDGLPQESLPGMLHILDSLRLPYRFSTRYICLDQQTAQKEITSYRKGWQQGVFRFWDQFFNNPNARPNRDAQVMVEDAEEALLDVQGGYVGAGYLSSVVVLLHEDQTVLREWARQVRRVVLGLGFGCRIERINAVEAWLGTHPGNWWSNLRRPLLNTLNLADLLPLASVWPGERHNPCPFFPPRSRPLMVCTTQGATPFWFNLHVGDLGHALIVGPTGSGKSTLLALLAAQFRAYRNARVFVFDKGMSMFALSQGAGGSHYEIAAGGKLRFAPLQRLESDSDLSWAEEWVATLIELNGLKISPSHRNAIHEALVHLRANPQNMRSLTHFRLHVMDGELQQAIMPYTRDGALGWLLDGDTDTLGLESFTVFEIEELMNQGEKNLIPVLTYLFHRIEKSLDGSPTLLVLDEAWVMLGHPVFRSKIREWLKVMRKANCAVVLATQSLSDAQNSNIFDVLVESCLTKILLANEMASQEMHRRLYSDIGLNEREIEIVADAIPKHDYYLISPLGRRLIQLALGKSTLAWVGRSDKDGIARIKSLQREHPDAWRDVWMAECTAA